MRTFITISMFLTTLALSHFARAAEPAPSEKKETKAAGAGSAGRAK